MAAAMTRTMPPAEMEARAGEVAALLKTLSHPARLRLACALAEGEYAVGEHWHTSRGTTGCGG